MKLLIVLRFLRGGERRREFSKAKHVLMEREERSLQKLKDTKASDKSMTFKIL